MRARKQLLLAFVLFIACLAGCGGGGSSPGAGTSTDGTPIPADSLTLSVISTTPAHTSRNISVNHAIQATFNKPLNPATLTSATFLLSRNDNSTTVTGDISYDAPSKIATFRPQANLAESTTYTATLTTGIKDAAGNPLGENYIWQFTTYGPPSTPDVIIDKTGPTVISTFPGRDVTGVFLNSSVVATFSDPIDPTTITTESITLTNTQGSEVPGTLFYTGTSALFRPAGDLESFNIYTCTISSSVKDLAGNSMAGGYSWKFTTGDARDATVPQVLSVTPEDEAVGVSINASFVANFNEAILPFEFGLVSDRPVKVAFNSTYRTVSMQPTVPLTNGETYTTSILVADMAGNLMSQTYVWRFTVEP